MKRTLALATAVSLAAVIGVSGWIQWRLHLNASGYCEKTGTYNDKDSIIRLAVANELKHMKAFGESFEGQTLAERKSRKDRGPILSAPAYIDLEDFFRHNPLEKCCQFDPDLGEGVRIGVGFNDKLDGYHRGLLITWAIPYLEEDGTKVFTYRGDKKSEKLDFVQKGFFPNYHTSMLLVNNCGETREGWDEEGMLGGR